MLGDTTQKLQKVASMAEDVYKKLNELRAQVNELRETVERTADDVDSMQVDLAEQRALLTALAEEQGIDVEEVLAAAAITEAESKGDDVDETAAAEDEATDDESAASSD